MTASVDPDRPKLWAIPMQVTGLNNLFQVTPDLFRSAQIDNMQAIKNLPIKTIVNLRNEGQDDTPLMGVKDIWLPMDAAFIGDEDVIQFLRIAMTDRLQPVLVHCVHGSDRTGTMIAAYRIVVQGWNKELAIEEMIHGGYGFHVMYINLPEYLRDMNVQRIREEIKRRGPWKD
jgi:protein tyrosine phosphatase (PTP) superfamily phosphohydrolase (DUF442 family)